MRSLIVLGAIGLVAGSPAPAPALVNFDLVDSVADPTLVGPPVTALSQTDVYDEASASASAVAAVTGIATAVATAAEKRSLDERGFCIGNFCIGQTTAKSTSTSTAKPTSTAPTSRATITPSTSTTGVHVPSTCTPISWTNTNAFITTDTACPEPYEVGTYCGFINPEDPCAPQPDGAGPKTTPDTSAAFLANPVYHKLAKNAAAPSGYSATFKDLNATVNANSYMGLHTLSSYDVAACANYCDSTDLCTAFNIYIERDPAWNPEQCSCTGADVSSITNFKCTLWGSGVQPAAATNFGQTRLGFDVVVTGSNGYEKVNTTTPDTPSGWNKPQHCSGVHDHPRTCISEKLFKGVFDVNVCATYATQQNLVNKKSSILSKLLSLFGYNPGQCKMFNAFMLTKDGKAQGTYCKLFAQTYESSVATQVPGWSSGHFWGVESSWSYCSA